MESQRSRGRVGLSVWCCGKLIREAGNTQLDNIILQYQRIDWCGALVEGGCFDLLAYTIACIARTLRPL